VTHSGELATTPDPDSGAQQEAVERAIACHEDRPGALLPLLHAIQDDLGFVPPRSVARIADALNLSRAEVHGVLSFYHDFHTSPRGAHVLRLCRAEACQSMGAERLAASAQQELGIGFGTTTVDNAVTLEAVYCLGNCACAPAAMLDGEVHGRLDEAEILQLIRSTREAA
jgi:formate dehydrogenase subunit gamma